MQKPTYARSPQAAQVASHLLTRQSAVAHVDLPLDSGPTRSLTFIPLFEECSMECEIPFNQPSMENHVSLPWKNGDGHFFNPVVLLRNIKGAPNSSRSVARSGNMWRSVKPCFSYQVARKL